MVVDLKLSIWCMNPSLSFQELSRQKPRCYLLTSGTLTPFSSYESELRIPFPIKLENGHIINPQLQILSGILKRGPSGKTLNCSYNNRDDNDVLIDIGNTIVNTCRIVPNGVLVFFPSYATLNRFMEVWSRSDNILKRIAEFKTIVREPNDSKSLKLAINNFITNATKKGAIFLAVCKGKVAEGIDFSDELARAVIMVGIPFPSMSDKRVQVKKSYLNDASARNKNNEVAHLKKGEKLTGKEWYFMQGMRATNQAIGRVIRHKFDYGIVLLLDERFDWPIYKQQISEWIRGTLQTFEFFGNAYSNIAKFFKEKPAQISKASKGYLTMATEQTSGNQEISHFQEEIPPPVLETKEVGLPLNLFKSAKEKLREDSMGSKYREESESKTRSMRELSFEKCEDSRSMLLVEEDNNSKSMSVHDFLGLGLSKTVPRTPEHKMPPIQEMVEETPLTHKNANAVKDFKTEIPVLGEPVQGNEGVQSAFPRIVKEITSKAPIVIEDTEQVQQQQQKSARTNRLLIKYIQAKHSDETPTPLKTPPGSNLRPSKLSANQESEIKSSFVVEPNQQVSNQLPNMPSRSNLIQKPLFQNSFKFAPSLLPRDKKDGQQSQEKSLAAEMLAEVDERMKNIPSGFMNMRDKQRNVGFLPKKQLNRIYSDLDKCGKPHGENSEGFAEIIDLSIGEESIGANSVPVPLKRPTINSQEEDKMTCVICYEKKKDIMASKCGHVACDKCWDEWLTHKLECPVCKGRTRKKYLTRVHLNL